jgi:L-arabonate dehydrase
VKPSGEHVMEDFFYAGGLPTVMKALMPLLHGDAMTVNGKTVAENLRTAPEPDGDVVRSLDQPLQQEGGTVILYGNLCPQGAVFKQSAAAPELWTHKGKAVVFETRKEMLARIDDPDLEVDENSVLVMKNGGPIGAPGFPEWGHIPIPTKLLKAGVKDMVRISDARMSGTSFGADVLHVSPESAIGGPLAAVQTGDEIELNVAERRLTLLVDEAEIQRRLAAQKPQAPHYKRGYGKLFLDNVTQAHEGCDFRFLHKDAD